MLQELRYILAISENATLSRAAKALHISQPALSSHIRNLEQQLGITLFAKVKNRLSLTYEGEQYVRAAKSMLDIYDNMVQDISHSNEMIKGVLKVGLQPFRGKEILPYVLPKFYQIYPHVEVELYEQDAHTLEHMLLHGILDVALIRTPIQYEEIDYFILSDDELLLAVPPAHAAIREARPSMNSRYPGIDLKLFEDEIFIELKSGLRTRAITDQLLEESGIHMKEFLETKNVETLINLVSAGYGIGVVSESYAAGRHFLPSPRFFSIGIRPHNNQIAIAFRKGTYLTRYAQLFIEMAESLYQERRSGRIISKFTERGTEL